MNHTIINIVIFYTKILPTFPWTNRKFIIIIIIIIIFFLVNQTREYFWLSPVYMYIMNLGHYNIKLDSGWRTFG